MAEQGERRKGVVGREVQEGVGAQVVLAGGRKVGQLRVVQRAGEELLHGVMEERQGEWRRRWRGRRRVGVGGGGGGGRRGRVEG